MAKAKSKKITLEEALVPVEEQPYAPGIRPAGYQNSGRRIGAGLTY